MLKSLPDRVAPWHLAQWGRQVGGQVPLARMPRLAKTLLDKQGEAVAQLVFGCDKGGRCYVHGNIKAYPQLICQCCLQPMEWPLDIQVRLALVVNDTGINEWREDYEPWVVAWEETASLWSLVEDELLLALPIAAQHSVDECPEGNRFKQAKEESREGKEGVANPFLVLNKLKHE